ncbi:hypothetical protein [Streptomyces virginiae]|uniref:hypothetical protein n=1 Tax=Streptomyces virginiae TaxID=1961 RepID=UPI003452C156
MKTREKDRDAPEPEPWSEIGPGLFEGGEVLGIDSERNTAQSLIDMVTEQNRP